MACSKLQPTFCVQDMLTCSVCLELVTEPKTLQCLHNYCTKCVQQLMDGQKNEPPGVVCPVCRSFCEEKDMATSHSSLHKESLEGNGQTTQKRCEQCLAGTPDSVAAWKCQDCCLLLCDTCRSQHLRIPLLKGHRILELSEETESVIDDLVFCSTHPDKPIEFYCDDCDEALCDTCRVVNHNGHNIVTVQSALDRMVTDIDQDLNTLDESLDIIDQDVKQCDVELEEVEKNFRECSDSVDREIEDRIRRLREEQLNMKIELSKEIQTPRALIQDETNQLISKKKEITYLRNVTRTSLEQARHASLLSELVSGGLCKRLKEVTNEPTNPRSLCIKRPTLQLNNHQWTALEEGGLLGEVVYTSDTALDVDGGKTTDGMNTGVSRFRPGNFTEFFQKPLTQTLLIELPHYCLRFTVCDDKLWVPIYIKGVIQIYTLDGKLVKSVQVEGNPTCVEKTSTGEILVSYAHSGLFVLREGGENSVKIADGSYSDVYVCGDSVYAWEWKIKQIEQFVKENGDWRRHSTISVGFLQNPGSWDTLLVRQRGEDRAEPQFFVCACNQNTVHQVNNQGDKVGQFGSASEQGDGELCYPRLCGEDGHGDILVADARHNEYKLLNPVSGSWRAVYAADSSVYNATMDRENIVWLSHIVGCNYVITKHGVKM